MNFLVTASSGFIGSRFIKLENKFNDKFKYLTRNSLIKNKKFLFCDFTKNIDNKIFNNIDIVIHIAGYAHENNTNKFTDKLCYDTNYKGTIKLAKIAKLSGVKKFIFLSSIKSAGKLSGINISEDCQGKLISQYSKSKRKAETDLLRLVDVKNFNVVIIRSSLVYGPNMKGNLRTLYIAIKKNLMPKPPKAINRRSMIHIDDLIASLMFVSKNDLSNNQIYNVTDNQIYDLNKIYSIFINHLKIKESKLMFPKFLYFLFGIVGSIINKLFYFPYSLKQYESMFEDSHFNSNKINKLGFLPKNNLENSIKSILD